MSLPPSAVDPVTTFVGSRHDCVGPAFGSDDVGPRAGQDEVKKTAADYPVSPCSSLEQPSGESPGPAGLTPEQRVVPTPSERRDFHVDGETGVKRKGKSSSRPRLERTRVGRMASGIVAGM